MRVYIAGRIKNAPDYHATFAQAAETFRLQGWEAYNPAAANQEGRPLNLIMGHVLAQLCDCDAIAMLPGWWRSGGARIEWLLARYLGLQIIWL